MITLFTLLLIAVVAVVAVGLIALLGPIMLIPAVFVTVDIIILKLIFRKRKVKE